MLARSCIFCQSFSISRHLATVGHSPYPWRLRCSSGYIIPDACDEIARFCSRVKTRSTRPDLQVRETSARPNTWSARIPDGHCQLRLPSKRDRYLDTDCVRYASPRSPLFVSRRAFWSEPAPSVKLRSTLRVSTPSRPRHQHGPSPAQSCLSHCEKRRSVRRSQIDRLRQRRKPCQHWSIFRRSLEKRSRLGLWALRSPIFQPFKGPAELNLMQPPVTLRRCILHMRAWYSR
jgi:hypothetical protein